MRIPERTTSPINTSDVEKSMGSAVGKNHVGECRSLSDPLLTGTLATLTTEVVRQRQDMTKQAGTLKEDLVRLLRSVAEEAKVMQSKVWGENRPNEFRTPFCEGYDFVIRITDAASGHTKKTFTRGGGSYSAMMMLWFTVEESQPNSDDESKTSINPLILEDATSPSGVAFLSNKELLTQFPKLSPEIQQLLANTLSIAVGFLQDELGIPDHQVSQMIDISMGIGSRLSSETLGGRQPPASQSGPLGHIVIVYHNDEERDTEKMELVPASTSDLVKVMDPWVELMTSRLGPDMLAIAKSAIADEETLQNVEAKLTQKWDGFDMEFPQAVNVTTAYSVSSAIYTRFASIHQASVRYYKEFLRKSSDVIEPQRISFTQLLRAYGVSNTAAEPFAAFLETLQPSTALVKELRQSGDEIDEQKNLVLKIFEEKVAKYNTEHAKSKRFEQRAKQQYHLETKRAELMNLLTIQDPSEDQKRNIELLQNHIVSYQKHVLMAEVYGQRFLDPVFGSTKRSEEEAKQLDVLTEELNRLNQKKRKKKRDYKRIIELQKMIAAFPDKSETISTILPLDTLNAVNLIRDFSLESGSEEILVSTQRLSFSATGRGGYEVTTNSGQIKRQRPA